MLCLTIHNTQISIKAKHFCDLLQKASPHRGQDGSAYSRGEGYLGGWDAVSSEGDGIAAVCVAAGDVFVVGNTQEWAGDDGVAVRVVVPAALEVKAHEVWEGRESCGERATLD